jgi:hypothetical protein
MVDVSPIHWLVVLGIIVLLLGGRESGDLGNGSGGGPQHPLPAIDAVKAKKGM